MPHVDEGQLHAYLDRGPGDATASDLATFESHIAVCEDCQGRLEEARRLRDRAHEILARGGPGDIEVPPFEELLARSAGEALGSDASDTEATDGGASDGGATDGGIVGGGGPTATLKRRWRSGNFPLAWAATVMIAVGAGWMARQVTMSSSEFGELTQRPAAEVLTESAETPAQPAATIREPAATQTALTGQESLDRLEAKVDDQAAGRRANVADDRNQAADLADGADQRVAAKSVVTEVEAEAGAQMAEAGAQIAEAGAGDRARRQAEAAAPEPGARAEVERRDGADEEAAREAAREPAPLVARDAIVAQADADNQRKAGDGEVDAVGGLARRVAPEDAVPAAGHAALGCYALDVDWSQAGAPPLPARIQLLAVATSPDPSGGEYFRDEAVGRTYELSAVPASASRSAYWLPFGTDSLLVRLAGDGGLVEFRLQVTDGELSGVAHAMAPALAGAGEVRNAAAAADAPMGAPVAEGQGAVRGRSIDCSDVD